MTATIRTLIEERLDALAIGSATGLLWHRPGLTLAGIGEAARIAIERPLGAGAAQAALSELGRGAVAFGALPFDRTAVGELIVPEVVVGTEGESTWVNATDGSAGQAVARVIDFEPPPQLPSQPTTYEIVSPVEPEVWRDEVVAPTQRDIAAGEVRKVVLARELVVTADQPIDLARVLARLAETFGTATTFAVDGFIGASPELLVGSDGDRVHAHPLAGTAARSTDPARDRDLAAGLATSTKNAVEHRITIDWLLDNLLPFCSYVDAEPEPSIVTLANVHHLGTRVEGRLSKPAASVLELVAALHPTPAVGGDPQGDALARIDAIEPGDRARYAGPVGWVDGAGNGEFAVGLRSGTFTEDRASLWAGVGVVGDSDPEAELEETRSKFQAMLGALIRP